ncbi:hypothetical protein [Streptomyces sp. NPDC047009]|uniref:hypothetical protein n=1 Tax=Streptomyces sp. NPDC047009 TaxID=3154496 RepID=UPI0033E7B304
MVGTSRVRRAAGTKTFTDLMLHWEQNRRVSRGPPATDPTLDLAYLAYLAAGEPMAVVAHRRDESRLRPGTLILHTQAGEPITWFSGRFPRRVGSGLPMRAPIDVNEIREVDGRDKWRVKSQQFIVIDTHAEGEPWSLAVPVIDLDLVLAAFAAVSS